MSDWTQVCARAPRARALLPARIAPDPLTLSRAAQLCPGLTSAYRFVLEGEACPAPRKPCRWITFQHLALHHF
jgi:hypothetical protein